MTVKTDDKHIGRREFFRRAGVTAGAVGVAGASLGAVVTDAEAATPEPTGSGYRETDHVRRVYETARF